VAQLVGTPRINLLESVCEANDLQVPQCTIRLPLPENDGLPSSFLLGVRPEDVRIRGEGAFPGEVALIEPLGVETIVHVKAGEKNVVSLVPGMTDLRLGEQVRFDVIRPRLHYFRPDGTRI
jgi:multiple sugar transport system ATP-binding protein